MELCSVCRKLADKERPPRVQRGKRRPHSGLSNYEEDCKLKAAAADTADTTDTDAWLHPTSRAFCFVLFSQFWRRNPGKMSFSALLPSRTVLPVLGDVLTPRDNESS